MKKFIVLFLAIMAMVSCDTDDAFDAALIGINNHSSHDVIVWFDLKSEPEMVGKIIKCTKSDNYLQFSESESESVSFVVCDLNDSDTLYIHESSPFVQKGTVYYAGEIAGNRVPDQRHLLFELTLTDELFADWQAEHRNAGK